MFCRLIGFVEVVKEEKMKNPLLADTHITGGNGDVEKGDNQQQLSTVNIEATNTIQDPAEDDGQFGNAYWRWTILYAMLIFIIAVLPFVFSLCIPKQAAVVNAIILMIFAVIWIMIAINALCNFYRMGNIQLPSVQALESSQTRTFTHVVIVPCYLDPIEVLFDCIGSLLIQQDPKSLMVVVAFEATTPDLLIKEQTIHEAFKNRFGHFLISVHTVDKSKEIAGGCSNKNYALHEAHRYLKEHQIAKAGHAITITTCDTDSLFHPNYFKVLEMVYNNKNPSLNKPPCNCVWQSPLFYNWDLDQRPFFNRVTCLMRSMMMLGGLISFNLNPMSIFSYPIELGMKAGFINPRYGVDDIIAKVRWMCATNEAVPVELLPVPSISGPTIGVSFLHEYEEWSRQIRRWIVGSSESFHYFVIHWRGKPLFAGIWWFFMFFSYYAVLLCCAGINSVLAGIPYPWVSYPDISVGFFTFNLKNIGLIFLIIQYIVFAVAFFIDLQAKRMMTVKEEVGFFRNIAHWLLAPPTLLWYSCIAFASIISFTWKGKKMARHDMAAKDGMESRAIDKVDINMPVARNRSTSTSRDVVNSTNQATQKDHKGVLCTLPERFYFGEYSVQVQK